MTNELVTTPIVDKNGVPTTRKKKVASTTAGTSRVAALGAKPKEVKQTLIKRPDGWYPNISELDVITVGPKKVDSYNEEQDIYLNGKLAGTVGSNSETQHSKIKGSRLIRYGADRKVWRGSATAPKGAEVLNSNWLRSDDFSRARAVYDLMDRYKRAEEIARSQDKYADGGGIFFSYTGEGTDWAVNGRVIEAPEGTKLTLKNDPGWLTKTALLAPSERSSERAELDFNSASNGDEATPVTYRLSDGQYNFYSFERDGSLWAHQGNKELNEQQTEFIAKVEEFTKNVFAARRN